MKQGYNQKSLQNPSEEWRTASDSTNRAFGGKFQPSEKNKAAFIKSQKWKGRMGKINLEGKKKVLIKPCHWIEFLIIKRV